jgi:hypothetical protein
MTTFGVEIGQHLAETSATIPPLIAKCVNEIEKRGLRINVRASATTTYLSFCKLMHVILFSLKGDISHKRCEKQGGEVVPKLRERA